MPRADRPAPPYRVAVVLSPDCAHLAMAMVTEPLFIANWLAGVPVFDRAVLSVDGLPVRSSSGTVLAVDAGIGGPRGYDAVIVVASFDSRAPAADPRLLNGLRRAARFGAMIGAVETGSEVLAAAGLLDGHQAAVHWYNRKGFAARFPGVAVTERPFTMARGRMTAAGGMAILDMMIAFIATRADAALAGEVARHLMMGTAPDPRRPVAADRPDPFVARALEMIAAGSDGTLHGKDIAAAVGLSERQLQRRFAAATGTSLGRSIAEGRMGRAHQLVQQTDMPVTEIALACGFGSPEHFSRSYRQRFGRPPRTDRRQSLSASVLRVAG
jgi:AraC family transcriptional regulator, carnitine catabolism transcriptional activator